MSLLGGKITGGSRPFRGNAMLFALACSYPFRLVRCVLNKRVQLLCGTISQSRVKMCRRASLHLVMARNGNRKLLLQRYADYVADSRAFTSLEREEGERDIKMILAREVIREGIFQCYFRRILIFFFFLSKIYFFRSSLLIVKLNCNNNKKF